MAKSNVIGLDGAQRIMDLILASSKVGAEWVSSPRKDGITNREVIKHLAEGNRKSSDSVTRDIRPTKEDSKKTAQIFVNEIANKMRLSGKLTSAGSSVTREKAAKQGIASACRKSCKHIAKVMYDRVKKQQDNTGSPAHPVGQKYAQQRLRKHGVATSVVFIASNQLADALQKGKVKIDFKGLNMRGLLSAVNRAKL